MAVNGYAAAQDVADLKVSTAALAVAMGTRVNLVEVRVDALETYTDGLPALLEAINNAVDAKVNLADYNEDQDAVAASIAEKVAIVDYDVDQAAVAASIATKVATSVYAVDQAAVAASLATKTVKAANGSDFADPAAVRTNIAAVGSVALASTTPGSEGTSLVGGDEGLTIAAPMVIRDMLRSGPLYASRMGLVGNSSPAASNNVTKLQSALNDVAGKRSVVFDVDALYLDQNINVPVGADQGVDLHGLGQTGPNIWFTGPAVTTGFTFTGSGYSYSGGAYDMNVISTAGAKRAFTFHDLNHPKVHRSLIRQFDGAGIYGYGCLLLNTEGNLIVGSGNATECAVVVTGADHNTVGAIATHYLSKHDRVSGGAGAGGTGIKGGWGIDRCSVYELISSQAESTGTPVKIGAETSSVRGCDGGRITGMGLENPGNSLPYIDVGQGWVGAAGQATRRLRIESITASPSGSTSSLYGARFKNTTGVGIGHGVSLGLTTGAVSVYEFEGSGNARSTIDANPAAFGNSYAYVRVNGTQALEGSPLAGWASDQVIQVRKPKTVTGTTIDLSPFAVEGGLYNVGVLNNGSATTVNNLTPWVSGAEITLWSTNANSTLAHLGGGTGQFHLAAGVNLAMVQYLPYRFIAVGSTGRWHQIP